MFFAVFDGQNKNSTIQNSFDLRTCLKPETIKNYSAPPISTEASERGEKQKTCRKNYLRADRICGAITKKVEKEPEEKAVKLCA